MLAMPGIIEFAAPDGLNLRGLDRATGIGKALLAGAVPTDVKATDLAFGGDGHDGGDWPPVCIFR